MSEKDYTRYLESLSEGCGQFVSTMTTVQYEGSVYAFFRCGDVEPVAPAKGVDLLTSGPIGFPKGPDGLLYQKISAHDLPDVPDLNVPQRAALIEDLARVFGPPDPKAAKQAKAGKKPKAKKVTLPDEYPVGVPNEPWAKETPPIKGFTWHEKLWEHMDPFSRVVVFMGQLQMLAKISRKNLYWKSRLMRMGTQPVGRQREGQHPFPVRLLFTIGQRRAVAKGGA